MFIRLFAALFLFVCTMAESANLPELTVEYSADRTMEVDQGTMHGRIVATPSVERSELRIGDMSTVKDSRGLGLGDTAAKVKKAYGASAVASPHKYQDKPAEYITVWDGGPRAEP